MIPPIISKEQLKKIALFSYVHYTLSEAKEFDEKNKGKIVIEEHKEVRAVLEEIHSHIEKLNYTYDMCCEMVKKFPQLATYYNSISGTIKAYFVVGDGWIPSLIALSLLQEYTIKGIKDFEHIDFTKLIDYFIKDKRADSMLHLKCACKVIDNLEKAKYKRK